MPTSQIAEKRIADLTVDEFQALMRETMQEVVDQVQAMIWEFEQQLSDPDAGRELRPGVAAQIQQTDQQRHSLDQVKKVLEME